MPVLDELVELLDRQTAAVTALEGRLRALELVVAAGEQRFVTLALDELERASEQLAGLELTRVLALATAGLPADVTASDLTATFAQREDATRLHDATEELRVSMRRVLDARERATVVVATTSQDARTRLEVASAFSGI
jgi:hypothetical protein